MLDSSAPHDRGRLHPGGGQAAALGPAF